MEKEKPQILRGNFVTQHAVTGEEAKDDLTSQFEREALKRLGGSIAFVSKKKFLFGMGTEGDKTGVAPDSQINE
jgi:hypothetical protein